MGHLTSLFHHDAACSASFFAGVGIHFVWDALTYAALVFFGWRLGCRRHHAHHTDCGAHT
jgi:hypothetical protein